jgi:tripartite-type tricarboxylate transporter receptor subunit TctC
MIGRRSLLGALTALAPVPAVRAQGWAPDRPIRLIVPLAPGGFNDTIARFVANGVSGPLGQPVVVDNRAGGAGIPGAEAVARATPDGQTLLVASLPHAVNAALQSTLPFDPVEDFTTVCVLAQNPNLFVVHPSVPARSLGELVALIRANPGKYSYASNSVGGSSHLGMEMFRRAAGGLDIVHVPYRGSAPAMTDLLAGNVQMTIDNLVFQAPFVREGKLRALAVTTRQRSPLFPEVPTVEESGFPGFEAASWFIILAPKGTPAPVVTRLNAEMAKVLQAPDAAEKLTGSQILALDPAASDTYYRRESEKWIGIARAVGARVDGSGLAAHAWRLRRGAGDAGDLRGARHSRPCAVGLARLPR